MHNPSNTYDSFASAGMKPNIVSGFIMTAIVIFGVLAGLIISIGAPIFSAAIIGLIIGLAFLTLPLGKIGILMIFLTLVFQGLIVYFGNVSQASWLPNVLGIAIGLKLLPKLLIDRDRSFEVPESRIYRWLLVALALHLLFVLYTTLINFPSINTALGGLRNYIPLWFVTLMLLAVPLASVQQHTLWRLLTAIFLIQVPIVLYQFFFVISSRADELYSGAIADGVVGSFGGNSEGGGHGPSLIVFCFVVMSYWVARWRSGLSNGWKVAPLLLLALSMIALAEVKAALLWFPLVLLYLYRKDILRRPARVLLMLVFLIPVMLATGYSYHKLYWSKGQQKSIEKQIEAMSYFFDPKNIDYRTGEVSRGASLAIWWNDGSLTVSERLLGAGAGSARRSQTVGRGSVAARYAPLAIASTAVAGLLWETGAIGLFLFMVILIGGVSMASRLIGTSDLDEEDQAAVQAIGVFFLLALTLMPYNSAVVEEPTIQFMLAGCLGMLGLLSKKAERRRREQQEVSTVGAHAQGESSWLVSRLQ
jgi:hypothetical protein